MDGQKAEILQEREGQYILPHFQALIEWNVWNLACSLEYYSPSGSESLVRALELSAFYKLLAQSFPLDLWNSTWIGMIRWENQLSFSVFQSYGHRQDGGIDLMRFIGGKPVRSWEIMFIIRELQSKCSCHYLPHTVQRTCTEYMYRYVCSIVEGSWLRSCTHQLSRTNLRNNKRGQFWPMIGRLY